MLEEPGPGQTPLTKEQKAGLLLPLVSQAELNAAEADSIVNARTWAMVRSRSLSSAQVLREDWLKRLHKRMFDSIWKWAGTYRHADVNIPAPGPGTPILHTLRTPRGPAFHRSHGRHGLLSLGGLAT